METESFILLARIIALFCSTLVEYWVELQALFSV